MATGQKSHMCEEMKTRSMRGQQVTSETQSVLLNARVLKTDSLPICMAVSKFAAALLKVNSNVKCYQC